MVSLRGRCILAVLWLLAIGPETGKSIAANRLERLAILPTLVPSSVHRNIYMYIYIYIYIYIVVVVVNLVSQR